MQTKRQEGQSLTGRVFTRHCAIRAQQRGLRSADLGLIEQYGREYSCPGEALAYYIGRRVVVAVRREHGIDLAHLRNVVLIVSSNGSFVTVFRSRRPALSWRVA